VIVSSPVGEGDRRLPCLPDRPAAGKGKVSHNKQQAFISKLAYPILHHAFRHAEDLVSATLKRDVGKPPHTSTWP